MKFFVAALSALLAVASAVPIYDVTPTVGSIGGYGDIMDVYKTMKYMGGDVMGIKGLYNPMYMLWAGLGGMSNTGMGVYGTYSPLYHNYGLMGLGNSWDVRETMGMNWYPGMFDYGMYGGGLVGDMYTRGLVNPIMMNSMLYKSGWSTVDKMACYHRYGKCSCLFPTFAIRSNDYKRLHIFSYIPAAI
nr:unnamed protein product [Callosobruchus analis]